MNTHLSRLARLAAPALLLAACGARAAGPDEALVTREMDGLEAAAAEYAMPGVSDVTLDNGLRVLAVERPGFPTVAVRLLLPRAGEASAPSPAVAELVVRTLRDGTATASADEIAARIDANGISYSASVSPDGATLAADGLSDSTDTILALLADLAANATLPTERFEARRSELAGELRLAQARESFHLNRLVRRLLYGEHPYGRTADADAAAGVAHDDVLAFHDAAWTPTGATLIAVGALPPDFAERVAAHFGTWTSDGQEPAPVAYPDPIATCNVAHVVERPGSAQTAVAWIGPGSHPLNAAYFDALVANQVLGGGASARLFMNLREQKSFTYGAYSALSHRRLMSHFQASSNVRGEVTGPALEAFVDEFTRLDGSALPGDELLGAQDYLAGVFPIRLERNGRFANELAWAVSMGLRLDYFEMYRDQVRSVDADRAGASAATLVDPARLTLVMVGEPAIVREAAPPFASRVFVYDLDGKLIDELDGELESTCGDGALVR